MTTRVHFVYRCSHILELQDDLVPTWILKEYFSDIEYDPNTWQGISHDYGSIPVDDDCSTCKETAARQRRKESGKTPAAVSSSSTTTSSSTSSPEQGNGSAGDGGKKE